MTEGDERYEVGNDSGKPLGEPGLATVAAIQQRFPSCEEVYSQTESLRVRSGSAWAVMPEVAIQLSVRMAAEGSPRPRRQGQLHNATRALVRKRGPRMLRVGPVLFLSTSIQTDRVLAPVMQALSDRHGQPVPVWLAGLNPLGAVQAFRQAARSLKDYRTWFSEFGGEEPASLEEEVVKSEIFLHRTVATGLHRQGIRAVVVANQHNGPTRAILMGLNRAGPVATFYVPHAPVAETPYYRDLPVHYALLRGDSEVEFYSKIGVDSNSRLSVVGQTGTGRQDMHPIPEAEHVVYATSTFEDSVIRSDIAVISEGCDRPVHVCLHPRSSHSSIRRLFPHDWNVHPPGPTIPVLRDVGAYALIQHDSGVGLEALAFGAEVIDFGSPGSAPRYPYIATPYVQRASNSSELRSALAAIPARRAQSNERRRYAECWSAAADPTASIDASNAILQAADSPVPTNVLLDSWPANATGGTAAQLGESPRELSSQVSGGHGPSRPET